MEDTMPTSKLLLAGGSIMPAVEKFWVSREEFQAIGMRLYSAIHLGDVLILVVLSICTVPLFTLIFGSPTMTREGSYLYQLASHISQAAKLAILVYVFDCFMVICLTLGFNFATLSTMSNGFAKILYISWLGQRFSVFKRYLLGRAFLRSPEKLGRASTIDRLLDGMIYAAVGFFLLDILDVDMGVGLTSIFAFGSAGTLVVGLASQSLATMFVNGLVLTTSDRITEGDFIKLGSGLSGKVEKIGWFQTILRHSDELCEIIPNSELGMQRVTNMSRVKRCQVKQDLRFPIEDFDRLDALLPAILKEIQEACPEAITDGSRPFRAYLTAIREDHLRVSVDVRFNLPPMGEEYSRNKHECLKAICRATAKSGLKFVSGIYPNGIND